MRFIDLFCGLGGFRYALEKHGARCVLSSDNDKYVAESYYLNFKDNPLNDITKILVKDIPEFDCLTAGFPCQPFSIAGHRKGFEDVRGTLFFDIVRILNERKPEYFILENVKGLINHDKGRTFKTMLNTLASKINGVENSFVHKDCLDYNVFWSVLNASDYNVPQNRERVFIVGFRNKIVKYQFPQQERLKNKLENIIEDRPNQFKQISDLSYKYIIKYLSEHNKYNEIKNLKYLVASEIRRSRVNFRFDNISPCLTTKMGTGGNNVPYLVNHKRFFTLKECLSLQSFPKNYKLVDNYSESLKQLGNTVVIKVVEKVFSNMIRYSST